MSIYEEELDYIVDPLEGVDIWGEQTGDDVAAMADMEVSTGFALARIVSAGHACSQYRTYCWPFGLSAFHYPVTLSAVSLGASGTSHP